MYIYMYLYIWIGRYTSGAACSAHTCRGHKIALPQSSSFRRCVVLSCVSSCERKSCANKETNVRWRNLRATTPKHIRCRCGPPKRASKYLAANTNALGKTACTCNFENLPHHHRHPGLTRCSQLDFVSASAASRQSLAWPVPRWSFESAQKQCFVRIFLISECLLI